MTTFSNINWFIKQINLKDEIKVINLFEQYYFAKKKENIKIYHELIEKRNNKPFKIKTIEEKAKYQKCLYFWDSEIKKAKKVVKEDILIMLIKLIKI